jgi:hypothetical protein
MNESTIKKVMAELGRRGGKKSSKKKQEASRKSLAKARLMRWKSREVKP